jgi:hypothetical protein
MPTTRTSRALLVVSSLVSAGRADLRWLYQFLQASGTALAELLLVPQYGTYRKLVGAEATRAAFLTAIEELGGMEHVVALDVILMLHGRDGLLLFEDGAVSSADLKGDLLALGRQEKLRLLYSTLCYGGSHTDDLLDAGFKVAVGAIGTNANGSSEYPIALMMWAHGSTIGNAIRLGAHALTRIPADLFARAIGFADVNSVKVVRGNSRITIDS